MGGAQAMTQNEQVRVLLEQLIAEISDGAARTYRLEPERAAELIAPVLSGNKELVSALSRESDLKRLYRMRVVKDAVAASRRAVYFGLRRYRQDEQSLLTSIEALESIAPRTQRDLLTNVLQSIASNHVSTAERLGHVEKTIEAIFDQSRHVGRILDVGSGVFPLLVPMDSLPGLATYVALDRDEMAIRALQAYSTWRGDGKLIAGSWTIADGWETANKLANADSFDLALLLKVVPVVQRREPELLGMLAKVPANRLVITGSREAMVKRRSIAHREAAILTDFSDRFGFEVCTRFETEDEIGLVLVRP